MLQLDEIFATIPDKIYSEFFFNICLLHRENFKIIWKFIYNVIIILSLVSYCNFDMDHTNVLFIWVHYVTIYGQLNSYVS